MDPPLDRRFAVEDYGAYTAGTLKQVKKQKWKRRKQNGQKDFGIG